jgi:hypothetical protein
MGLNFHSETESFDAQWSFSGFKSFRGRLAKEIGIANINSMDGFCDWELLYETGDERKGIDRDKLVEAVAGRAWTEIDDAITPLLRHSDVDGDLSPEQCAQIAPRLKELVADWPDANEIGTQPEHQAIGYPAWIHVPEHDKRNAILLAKAMEWCAEHGESLTFSG